MTEPTNENLTGVLVGKSVIHADFEAGTLTLSDGIKIFFEKSISDCCAYLELTKLATTDNIITAVEVDDNETDNTSEYSAWIKVITEAGELNIAEAEGDIGTGYYIGGFALRIRVV